MEYRITMTPNLTIKMRKTPKKKTLDVEKQSNSRDNDKLIGEPRDDLPYSCISLAPAENLLRGIHDFLKGPLRKRLTVFE